METFIFLLAHRTEFGVRAVSTRKVLTILIAQGAHQCVTAFFANLASLRRILIPLAIVQALGKVSLSHVKAPLIRIQTTALPCCGRVFSKSPALTRHGN
jgi:hypothetical protein